MTELRGGLSREVEFVVEEALLTDVAGTLGKTVLSTPGMIAVMERNAAMLAAEELPPGKATVGFEVCVKHVAPALPGARCVASATLERVEDSRKLHFKVETREAGRLVGIGTHQRRIVDAQPPGSQS